MATSGFLAITVNHFIMIITVQKTLMISFALVETHSNIEVLNCDSFDLHDDL